MRNASASAFARAAREKQRFYFRVGHNDHVVLNRLLAEGKLHVDGLVLDARRHERHRALRRNASDAELATCLDTQAMELAMPGTASQGHAELPWAEVGTRAPKEFSPSVITRFIESIVARVTEGGYTQVMAPAHYLAEASSEWLEVDDALTRELRAQLDAADLESVEIIYPLSVHHSAFYEPETRAVLERTLRSLNIDVISLRVHPFGSSSGPLPMRHFIEACHQFRRVGTPLMIERAGIAGLSAYALGAVDLIESGITTGDSFDVGSLQKRFPAGREASFGVRPRVYVEALGITVDRKLAAKLLSSSRGKLHFACKNGGCCPNGSRDMLADAERHSALARQRQYAELARVPPTMRADYFIQQIVTPACDRLARASDLDESFKVIHRRTLSVKEMLIDLRHKQEEQRSRSGAVGLGKSPGLGARVIPLIIPEPRRR
jgi:hypothetical protein